MRCVAIIMVRNGADYVHHCLSHLSEQGMEFVVLDHGSDDGTYDLSREFQGNGLVDIQRIPYEGLFSLTEQLKEKQKIAMKLNADWIIHQDIDECLEPVNEGETLMKTMQRADHEGYNVLNFNEFVFIPHVGKNQSFINSQYYYFFQPNHPRLMRAWKKNNSFSNLNTGGHVLDGEEIHLYPQYQSLRHYIFTDQNHAYNKYSERRFTAKEVAKGWHGNRLDIPINQLVFPAAEKLKKLPYLGSRAFDTSSPWKKHYWQY